MVRHLVANGALGQSKWIDIVHDTVSSPRRALVPT
jgi:hypothetical protein